MDLTTQIENITMSKMCSIKPDADSTDSKKVTLRIKYDGLTLGDVMAKAVRTDVIAWQNGPGRKLFHTWGDEVTISAKAPGQSQIDPETAMVNKLAGMSPEEQTEYIQKMIRKSKSSMPYVTV